MPYEQVPVDLLRRLEEAQALERKIVAEMVALRKDAERYRYLREQHWNNGKLCVVHDVKKDIRYLGCDCPSLERLDAVIDAEIAASK